MYPLIGAMETTESVSMNQIAAHDSKKTGIIIKTATNYAVDLIISLFNSDVVSFHLARID